MQLNTVIRNIQLVGVIFILIGTVVAFGFELNEMYSAGRVTLADLLLMFIYIEVIGMIGVFWESKTIRINPICLPPDLLPPGKNLLILF